MDLYKHLYKYLYLRLSRILVSYIKPYLSKNDEVLDIGSGNGYVAGRVIEDVGCKVTCVDVIDINKIGPAPIIYNGCKLPFLDKSFSVSLIIFCLHHAKRKRELLKEAVRVTKSKIIIMEDRSESIYDYVLNFWHKFISLIKFHSGYVQYLNDFELRKIFSELKIRIINIVKMPLIVNPTHPTRRIMYILDLTDTCRPDFDSLMCAVRH